MSKEITSIDDLKKTSTPEENVEAVEAEAADKAPENPYMKAAMERVDNSVKAKEEAVQEEIDMKRKMDGREYEYEVEGFNIGDSIMRRAKTLDTNGSTLRDALQEEALEKEVSSDFEDCDDFDSELADAVEAEVDNLDEVDEVTPAKSSAKDIPDPKYSDEEILPSQDDLFIDDDDLLDIDLDEEESSDASEDDDLSEKEMAGLREAIKEKLAIKAPVDSDGNIAVSNKAISLSTVLAQQSSKCRVVDFPLMSAGRCISMKEFSGTEIESLNRGASGRNRFNTLKEIYHTLWDHIVDDNKPNFEEWLKVTSFMDIDHLYMAAYKASFNGANYIPFNCENEQCGHIFLSDDIKIEDMLIFKDDAAKKKFYNILENTDTKSKEDSCLYETKIVPVSKTIAIGFREPSIYNTIFENSTLDQKFIDKYTKLLTMMVYIDNIYFIQNGEYCPVYCKKDRNSIAKSTKYRIATFSKIIQTLSSDEYNNIVAEITKINELGDEVKYQLPEISCPKCKQTIEALEQPATQLLFSRHQLSLLSQES